MPRRGEKLRKTWIGFDSILDRHGDESVSNRDAVRSPDHRTVCTELRTGRQLAVPRMTHKNSGVNKFYFVAVNKLRIYSVAL
jgi:hypothetical protein